MQACGCAAPFTAVAPSRRRPAGSTAPAALRMPACAAARAAKRPVSAHYQRHQAKQPQQQQQEQPHSLQQRVAAGAAALLASAALVLAPVAQAADTAAVGSCLLQNCQTALAQCLADGTCVKNLICLQTCNGRPDESECQIKCGDKYLDKAVETFTACAVSQKKCVPQRVDQGVYNVPPDTALDNSFDINNFQGRWYITAGLNPLFDTFDCQEHYFASPEPSKLYAKINWRVPLQDTLTGDPDFIERSVMQNFKQENKEVPAVLVNKDNEYLNYQDTWYILGFKPDKYVFIYYIGQNDAWVGYGGATVYTRDSRLPKEYIPELREAAAKAGLDWDKFIVTDNSCPPHPPQRSLPEKLEVAAARKAVEVEYELENDLRSFGRGFTVLERDLSKGLKATEQNLEQGVKGLTEAEKKLEAEASKASRMIQRFEMEAEMGLSWIPNGLRQIFMPMK